MTPEKVTISVQITRKRELELSASQVENIIKRWAIAHHGFSDRAEVYSDTGQVGLFRGITLTETTSEYRDSDDTEVSEI